jgi:hypothetical protein
LLIGERVAEQVEMIRQTRDEWVAEGERRFGPDMMKWRFVCPACGNVTTVEDFKPFADRGATPDRAAKMCIGRFDRELADCDWCSFGLLGTLGKGRLIDVGDERPIEVFDFAPSSS